MGVKGTRYRCVAILLNRSMKLNALFAATRDANLRQLCIPAAPCAILPYVSARYLTEEIRCITKGIEGILTADNWAQATEFREVLSMIVIRHIRLLTFAHCSAVVCVRPSHELYPIDSF